MEIALRPKRDAVPVEVVRHFTSARANRRGMRVFAAEPAYRCGA